MTSKKTNAHQAKSAVRTSLGSKAKSIHTKKPKAWGLEEFTKSKAFRLAMQRTAAALLFKANTGKKQKFRVCHCGRSIQGDVVVVYRATDGSKARFAGLTTCGSGWTCPVCSVRIGEVRREELSSAMEKHVKAGGRVNLLTMTFPHEFDHPLPELMEKFDKARQKFKNSRAYRAVLNKKEGKAGCLGCVSSLEITHGKHGWHPHLHMLSFTRRSITDDEIESLQKAWVNCLIKCGLGDSTKLTEMMEHALDVRGGEDAAAYIAKYGREEKWGITSELTRRHSKCGLGEESMTPFGLLIAYQEFGEEWAGEKFKEFANVFLGRRLITWSEGLRAQFAIDEADDQQAAESSDVPDERYVGQLDTDQWKLVLSRNARVELMRYVAECCHNPATSQDDLNDFVESLKSTPQRTRGWFYGRLGFRPLR
jgi:hypothetical protein